MYVVLRCSLINTFMHRHQVLTWDAVTVTDYREHRWTRSQSQCMCSNDPDTDYQTTPETEPQLDVHAQHTPWTFHAKRQKPAHTKSHSVVSHKKPHCHSTVYIGATEATTPQDRLPGGSLKHVTSTKSPEMTLVHFHTKCKAVAPAQTLLG